MKTVTATPMMSPMATTPPRIPITPPGGPCGSGFSADKRRNNSVRMGCLWVIDAAGMNLKNSSEDKETLKLHPQRGFPHPCRDNITPEKTVLSKRWQFDNLLKQFMLRVCGYIFFYAWTAIVVVTSPTSVCVPPFSLWENVLQQITETLDTLQPLVRNIWKWKLHYIQK